LHHDRDLTDPVAAAADDEQRLERVAEVVVREVPGKRAQEWIANCPKSRRWIADLQAAASAQRP